MSVVSGSSISATEIIGTIAALAAMAWYLWRAVKTGKAGRIDGFSIDRRTTPGSFLWEVGVGAAAFLLAAAFVVYRLLNFR